LGLVLLLNTLIKREKEAKLPRAGGWEKDLKGVRGMGFYRTGKLH
jgi:hypothetical protein